MQYYDLNIAKITDIIGNNNESFSNLFIFIIRGNSLSIKYKIDGLVYLFKDWLKNPIKSDLRNNIKNIYSTQYQLNNLLFYDSKNNYEDKIIINNSILFVESIDKEQLLNISKIVEQSKKMIKVIIVKINYISDNQTELIDFVNNNKIPIYELKNAEIYDNDFKKFFLKQKLDYINLNEFLKSKINIYRDENRNINDITNFYPSFKFNFYINASRINRII